MITWSFTNVYLFAALVSGLVAIGVYFLLIKR